MSYLYTEEAGWVLIGLCVLLVCLPPKYDPAIRLKEWLKR